MSVLRPWAPIWVGLLTLFRPPNALLCGYAAVPRTSNGCFVCPSTTSGEHPWDCRVLVGETITRAKKIKFG
jgi:hypothetical protein